MRQRLWSSVGLTQRAHTAAVKAVEAAVIYYGNEHPVTGRALAGLCESASHRGPLDEAISDAIHALAVHIKVTYHAFVTAVLIIICAVSSEDPKV